MKYGPIILILSALQFTTTLWAVGPVIYGEDDRKEIYESQEMWRTRAQGVAVLVSRSKLNTREEGIEIEQKTYRTWLEDILNGEKGSEEKNFSKLRSDLAEEISDMGDLLSFCPEEKFTNQPVPGDCTGFLIAPDLLLTAGHCVEIEKFCDDHDWVFDFQLDDVSKKAPQYLKAEQVYSCKRVVRHELNLSLGLDYGIVELDRRVKGREVLTIEENPRFQSKTKLTVIGSPSGLPLKVAGNGRLRSTLHPFFVVSTLDTYKGNSGSPVFNSETGSVEGILVRGEEDFSPDRERMCLKSKRCEGSECIGESVSKILSVPEISYRRILQDAVLSNDLNLLKQMDAIGVWVDMPSKTGVTPLMRAMRFPHKETVLALVNSGADVLREDEKGESPLHYLAPVLSENTQDVLEILLSQGASLEKRNDEGETAILKAARWLNVAAVKILIEAGADYTVQNAQGEGILDPFERISDGEALKAIQLAIEEKTLAGEKRID